MNLLRVAIAALLLPAGVPVQAADITRMAVDVKPMQPRSTFAPDAAKTPAPGGPVPLPYPNVVPVQPKEKAPKLKTGTGNEPGTLKGIVAKPGGQSSALRLNPLDAELDQPKLQDAVNQANRARQANSNVAKKKQDSDSSIRGNLK